MPICHGLEAGFGTGRRSAGGQSVSARVCGPCAKIIERRCQLIFGHTHTHTHTSSAIETIELLRQNNIRFNWVAFGAAVVAPRLSPPFCRSGHACAAIEVERVNTREAERETD